MIPPLDSRQLLPPGVHGCTLPEVWALRPGDLRRNLILSGLADSLQDLRTLVVKCGIACPPLVLGGSFFSDKPDPADIEITVILPASASALTIGEFTVHYFGVHGAWRATRLVDYYPTLPGSSDFRAYFQYVGPKTAAIKGLNPNDPRGVVEVATW